MVVFGVTNSMCFFLFFCNFHLGVACNYSGDSGGGIVVVFGVTNSMCFFVIFTWACMLGFVWSMKLFSKVQFFFCRAKPIYICPKLTYLTSFLLAFMQFGSQFVSSVLLL